MARLDRSCYGTTILEYNQLLKSTTVYHFNLFNKNMFPSCKLLNLYITSLIEYVEIGKREISFNYVKRTAWSVVICHLYILNYCGLKAPVILFTADEAPPTV